MALLFEELEVEILIVAKNPLRLKNTCEYLTQHGWPTIAMSDLPRTAAYIKEKRPHVVLISFNHPSPAVIKLPEVLDQSKEMICVGFVEGTDATSTDLLSQVKTKHKIFGEPSGSNLQRGISRILNSLCQPFDDAAETPVPPRKAMPEVIRAGLRDAIQKAISFITKNTPAATPKPLSPVRKIGVIPFESPDIPGYLVVADNQHDSGTLDLCASAVQAAYTSTRLPGKFRNAFWLDCPEVQFSKWAGASAFSMKCAHKDAEMGVAFFPAAQPLPRTRVTEDEMAAIDLEQIPAELPLPCRVYLHLHSNQKYFLYLKDGRRLQAEQKARLTSNGVREIFVKRTDLESLNKYWATLHLSQTFAGANA